MFGNKHERLLDNKSKINLLSEANKNLVSENETLKKNNQLLEQNNQLLNDTKSLLEDKISDLEGKLQSQYVRLSLEKANRTDAERKAKQAVEALGRFESEEVQETEEEDNYKRYSVYDVYTNELTYFNKLVDVADFIGCALSTVHTYIRKHKKYKDRYDIEDSRGTKPQQETKLVIMD